MAIGITEEHVELGRSLREWAAGADLVAAVRAAEGDADPYANGEGLSRAWEGLVDLGVPTIGLDESLGGGGGSMADVAVALEACAHGLVPGPLWSTATAVAARRDDEASSPLLGEGAAVAIAATPALRVAGDRLCGDLAMIWDAAGVAYVLAGAAGEPERWFLLPAARVDLAPVAGLDLTRRAGTAHVDIALADAVEVGGVTAARVREIALALAAAEASGVARWCLDTAVAYAKVREQFGAPIGSFQAIKHLCAQMLETAESVTAVAWDAAEALDSGDAEQARFAAVVAGAVALDGAVRVAQDAVQVLGGIGFTFEHDVHLYLRRAHSLRALLGSGDGHAEVLAGLAAAGVRRSLALDLEGRDADVRPRVRGLVDRVVSAADPRTALVDTGLLVPHWPEPYGLGADPLTQLVVDEELTAAGVERPDLKIAAWAVPTILSHGTEAQRERFVRPSLAGELRWCQLFSEPGAGSDLASLRTRAVRDDDRGGWRLSGQKVWTSLARSAEWAICLARTDTEVPQHRGITYFLVDMTSPGIDIRPLREMTGDAMFNEVFLDDVFVPDDCVVGEPGDGWRLARTTLANERVAMAGTRLGASTEGAVAALREDSPSRDRVRVGHAVALSTVCALLGTRTTLKALSGQGPGVESAVAKILGVRNRQDASELLVDLLGERVLLGGEDVEQALHEMLLTRCLSIAGGTTQILRNVAAERILGLPR
ncbi:MAG: acyl-CoA dehydrogenase [Nocardioides sp.]|nr:acyl-CoA dehydrogenase [Nocardioides sp.]